MKSLQCGQEVTILSQDGNWTRIRTADGKEGYVPTKAYENFFSDKKPAQLGAVIWTTAYGGSSHAALSRCQILSYVGFDANNEQVPGSEQHAFLMTFTAFRAVFQLLGYLQGDHTPTRDGPEIQRFLLRLWPATGESVTWPRNGVALNDTDLENFSKRTDFA
jgi:Bacterial SH3 domain